MASLINKVWKYKTFSELSPEAAARAIEDDTLFSTKVSWGQSIDPNLIETLFHSDGRAVDLTITERIQRFPFKLHTA